MPLKKLSIHVSLSLNRNYFLNRSGTVPGHKSWSVNLESFAIHVSITTPPLRMDLILAARMFSISEYNRTGCLLTHFLDMLLPEDAEENLILSSIFSYFLSVFLNLGFTCLVLAYSTTFILFPWPSSNPC